METKLINILLADDDEDDRFLTREAFRQHYPGSSVTFVEDGEELLDYLHRQGQYVGSNHPLPELILLDLNMPRRDGRDALRVIKGSEHLRHIPVVVLTTSDARPDIESSYGNGANSFITKPASFQRLADVARTIGQYWFEVVTRPVAERQ